MTDLARARQVFVAACDLPAKERTTYVEQACRGDAALAREVLSLLEHDHADDAAPDPRVGRTFGNYRIVRLLGEGGAGAVFEAECLDAPRRVAVKLLEGSSVSATLRRRFAKESSLLARLEHPAVAKVFDSGTLDVEGRAVPFFAMELVVGAQHITAFTKGRDRETTLRVFLQACDAVQHVHDAGVLHRDLKPGNLLVDENGRVKLIDLGIARASGAAPLLTTVGTEQGQLLGTLHYMAPEQCDGDHDDLDARCDVYSLGAVLHELLCGRPPIVFSATESLVSVVRRIQTEMPPRLSDIVDGIAEDLDAIVTKAIAKERSARYASVGQLADDVRAFLAGREVAASPRSRWARCTRTMRRHPLRAGAVVAALLAVAIVPTAVALAHGQSTAAASRERAALREGLIAHWTFDRADDPGHDSAGNHRAALPDSMLVTTDVPRVPGNVASVQFSGYDAVVIADASDLTFTTGHPMSLSLWLEHTSDQGVYHVLAKRADCQRLDGMHFQISRDGAGLCFASATGGSTTGCVYADGDLPLHEWCHLAFVYDGEVGRLYLRGRLCRTEAFQFSSANNSPLLLGRAGTCGWGFLGLMDDVRFYDRALSAAEITALAGGSGAK